MLSLGIGVNGRKNVSLYDANALAFINATGLTGTTEKTAVNNLVKNLKSYGLWSKMKAIYPFVSDTVNLLSYSQDFTNGVWVKSQISATSNTTTAPDSTNTASTLQNIGSGYISQSNLALATNTYTQSIYAKRNNNDWICIYTSDKGANSSSAWFNLNTGVKGSATAAGTFSATSSTMTSVGNGWYRCTVTFTKPTTAGTDTSIIIPSGDNTYSRVAGQNAYIWGAQIEISSTSSDYQYIATTPANRFVSQFKYNLKDPRDLDAAFRLAFNGTWTYSKQGATPNGANGYADTFFNPSVNAITNSNSLGMYVNVGNTAFTTMTDPVNMGCLNTSGPIASTLVVSQTSYTSRLNSALISATITDSVGMYTSTKQSATVTKLFKYASSLNSGNSGGTLPNLKAFIGTCNLNGSPYANGYVNNRFAFAHLSDGLTDTEATNLYTSVQLFQTTLNRQVP